MQELLVTLLIWIEVNTAYSSTVVLPNVIMTEPYNVCAIYGINNKNQCDSAKIMGFYNKNVTIYLHSNFQTENKVDQSRLLHELIHYLQWRNGKNKTTCLGHLEVEAYQIQDKWRVQNKLKKTLDPFQEIMLSASCDV